MPISLDVLNSSQREAVVALDGPVLIIAGAGSGKTRVLTYRIAYLIAARKAAPQQILAVTFTNKAANEMRQRVAQLVGAAAQSPWIGTFHSLCARILREHAEAVGYRRDFTIFDESDSFALLRTVVSEINLAYGPTPEMARQKIEQAKNEALTPSDLAATAQSPHQLALAEVYKVYRQRMRALNAVDFGDLILLVHELFTQQPDVLARWQERFRYLLVDEYQDTNHVQYLVIRALARASSNLCVVGDEDQSIYRWRGADIRNILDFERDFPQARVFKLEQNYRSTKTILSAAQSLIRHNRNRKPKELWTANEVGQPVTLYTGLTERDEAEFVVKEIQRLANRKEATLEEIVVFYRINAQSRPLEEALVRRRIPYRLIGGVRFYERREIKDLLAYLRVLVNPSDELSLERLIGAPPRGIGNKTLSALKRHAEGNAIDLMQAMGYVEGLSEVPLRIAKKVTELYEWLCDLRQRLSQMTVKAVLEEVLAKTRFLEYLATLPEAEGRHENVAELLSAAQAFDIAHGAGKLADFVESVALLSEVDEERGGRGVSLMTLHTSKGLEYPVVFIVGLEEGLFPHNRSQDDEAELEEERRLLYVGMTRARRLLYLTNVRSRELYGVRQEAQPSRFLAELEPSLVRRTGAIETSSFVVPSWKDSYVDLSDGQPFFGEGDSPGVTQTLRVGARVEHPTFGPGYVRRLEGRGESTKAWVHFDRGGLKLLAVKYARLRLIAGGAL